MRFRRPPPVELTLDAGALRRWHRAGRPPLDWFLGLAEDQQEAAAIIGDQYQDDVALGIARAMHDPVAAEAENGSEDAQEALLGRLAAAALSEPETPKAPQRMTTGGFGQRKTVTPAPRKAPFLGIR